MGITLPRSNILRPIEIRFSFLRAGILQGKLSTEQALFPIRILWAQYRQKTVDLEKFPILNSQ